MLLKSILKEGLVKEPAYRLATEAIKKFGKENKRPKVMFDKLYNSTDNEYKKKNLDNYKKEIISAIKELRK